MSSPVIRVENLSKFYRLGQIGTGTITNDLKLWWAKMCGKPNPLLKIGEKDYGNRDGEVIMALKDVSFDVQHGEVLGIIGRNGAGKSTLLKILSRVTAPTSGQIKVKGRVASLLEVGTGFHPELTGQENIYLNGAILGMTKEEVRRNFDEIVAFAEIEKFIDTPVKRYSSGMYVRLAFAVAAHLEPEILVVDEVLAVGDAEFQKKCLGKMGDVAKEGRTVLFVSHNLGAMQSLCNSGILLEKGRAKALGIIDFVINEYVDSKLKNPRYYDDSPISLVRVDQVENNIAIILEYELVSQKIHPSFGFVISDVRGQKIFGTNSQNDRSMSKELFSRGTVKVLIKSPKLLNGKYKLSIWLGDGNKDFFTDLDCLEFEVFNMVTPLRHLSNSNGPVYPECSWNYS